MTAPFVIRPGDATEPHPWRSVQDGLRHQYDAERAANDKRIADRKAKGIPLDDLQDWRASVGDLLDGIDATKDRADVVAVLEKAHAIANGAMRPMDPYVPVASLDGMEVRLRALSKADVMTMAGALASTAKGDDVPSIVNGNIAAIAVMRAFLAKCLIGVRGAQVEEGELSIDGLTPDDPRMQAVLDEIDKGGLLPAVFSVARRYNSLDPKERRHFALSPLSISRSESVPSARPSVAQSLDAKEGRTLLTSEVSPASKPTPVLDGTHSTTTTSSLPLSSFAVSSEVSPA